MQAAQNRGWAYIAITDHSGGLPIANGMPVEKLRRQHAALVRMAAGLETRVFGGVEV